jgi:hypothetical protein
MGVVTLLYGLFLVLYGLFLSPAWHLGFVGLGIAVCVVGVLIFCFRSRISAELPRVVHPPSPLSFPSHAHFSTMERRYGSFGVVARVIPPDRVPLDRWARAMTGQIAEIKPSHTTSVGEEVCAMPICGTRSPSGRTSSRVGEEVAIFDRGGRLVGLLPENIQAIYMETLRGVYTDQREVAAENAAFAGTVYHIAGDAASREILVCLQRIDPAYTSRARRIAAAIDYATSAFWVFIPLSFASLVGWAML